MKREDVKTSETYRITYPDKYKGKVAKVISCDLNGDVTLEFKNGSKDVYHATWLEPIAKQECTQKGGA